LTDKGASQQTTAVQFGMQYQQLGTLTEEKCSSEGMAGN
jgi:hypothetical protein